MLASLYKDGDGVAQDFAQAFHYYTQAETYEGAFWRAGMYALGQGVARDLEMAMKLALTAQQVIPEAATVIALIKELQARELPQFITDELILQAENGDQKIGWLVGTAYLTGTRGLGRDDKKGARLIQIAADAGDIRSSWLLSFLIRDGRGLPKDVEKGHAMYMEIMERRLYPSVYGEVLEFWKSLPPLAEQTITTVRSSVEEIYGEKGSQDDIGATLSVWWDELGDDVSITISPEDWNDIQSGEEVELNGNGCILDGRKILDKWHFSGGTDGFVDVTYSNGEYENEVGVMTDFRNVTIKEHVTPHRAQ